MKTKRGQRRFDAAKTGWRVSFMGTGGDFMQALLAPLPPREKERDE